MMQAGSLAVAGAIVGACDDRDRPSPVPKATLEGRGLPGTPEAMAERLTKAGFEVKSTHRIAKRSLKGDKKEHLSLGGWKILAREPLSMGASNEPGRRHWILHFEEGATDVATEWLMATLLVWSDKKAHPAERSVARTGRQVLVIAMFKPAPTNIFETLQSVGTRYKPSATEVLTTVLEHNP